MIQELAAAAQIVQIGLQIIDRFRDKPAKQPSVGPDAVTTFRQTVRQELGEQAAQRIRSDQEVQQGLNVMAAALADWQVSATPLCPLLLRKTIAFGTQEKNLGFLPAEEDGAFIESAYGQWKAWIDQGPRDNEGLLVFLLVSPDRETIDAIQALNKRKTSWYHKPRYGLMDVRAGTFYGPPRGFMDQYLMGFGVDSFWNEIMKGVGCLVT